MYDATKQRLPARPVGVVYVPNQHGTETKMLDVFHYRDPRFPITCILSLYIGALVGLVVVTLT